MPNRCECVVDGASFGARPFGTRLDHEDLACKRVPLGWFNHYVPGTIDPDRYWLCEVCRGHYAAFESNRDLGWTWTYRTDAESDLLIWRAKHIG